MKETMEKEVKKGISGGKEDEAEQKETLD